MDNIIVDCFFLTHSVECRCTCCLPAALMQT